MSEILKSLPLYNPTKGRFFAYLNRISKNNLILFNNKQQKYDELNINYTDILNDSSDDFNTTTEENIDNIINISNDIIIDEQTINDIENNNSNFIPKPKNKVIKCKSSLFIIYKYINFLFTTVEYYFNNKDIFNTLINNMKYDTSADFDLPSNYNYILENLYNLLYNIKNWMEQDYAEEIKVEPESYDGLISNRAIGYIRRFVKTKMKNHTGLKIYNTDELIKFIEYLVLKYNDREGI